MMKPTLLAATLACLSAPAFAQPSACPSGREHASEEFVEALNSANSAFSAKDYGRVLSLTAIARPAAASPLQTAAVTQIEIATLVAMNDRPTATRLIKGVMPDPCLPPALRANYIAKLAEWGVPAN